MRVVVQIKANVDCRSCFGYIQAVVYHVRSRRALSKERTIVSKR